MISNAKAYNEKSSELHSDAEKVRKYVCQVMTKINPAYADPNYIPYPTPFPDDSDEEAESSDGSAALETEVTPAKPRRSVILHGPKPENDNASRRATSTPGSPEANGVGGSFEKDTFQEAQGRIVSELIRSKDEE